MKTLLERLKPEVRLKLESNRDRYASSIDSIFIKLNDELFYDHLTLSIIGSIYTFAGIDLLKTSIWDLKYGDNILNPENDDED